MCCCVVVFPFPLLAVCTPLSPRPSPCPPLRPPVHHRALSLSLYLLAAAGWAAPSLLPSSPPPFLKSDAHPLPPFCLAMPHTPNPPTRPRATPPPPPLPHRARRSPTPRIPPHRPWPPPLSAPPHIQTEPTPPPCAPPHAPHHALASPPQAAAVPPTRRATVRGLARQGWLAGGPCALSPFDTPSF